MYVSLTCHKRVFQVGRSGFHSNTTNTSCERRCLRLRTRKHYLPVGREEKDLAVDGGLEGREGSGGR